MSDRDRNWRAGGREGRPTPKDEWRTPPGFYAGLNEEFGFTLDVACTQENQLAPAELCRDLGLDGLAEEWTGTVWCNPPYSNLRPWLERAAESWITSVLLVPGDTSTAWWYELAASRAAEILFVRGRLRFLKPNGEGHRTKRGGGGLTTPSAVLVYHLGAIPGKARYGYLDREGRRL